MMKNLKYRLSFIAILLAIIIPAQSFSQKDSTKKSDNKKMLVKNMLDSQHFIFVAQSASPLRGGFRSLTSYFDAGVSNDTLMSNLPYFGQAYTASYGSVDGPLNFTSTKTSYSIMPAKKSGWNVLIKLKDKSEIQQYLFTIYDNGSATLNITFTSRDPISFIGYITNAEKKKK